MHMAWFSLWVPSLGYKFLGREIVLYQLSCHVKTRDYLTHLFEPVLYQFDVLPSSILNGDSV
jgi:hypothetical protein